MLRHSDPSFRGRLLPPLDLEQQWEEMVLVLLWFSDSRSPRRGAARQRESHGDLGSARAQGVWGYHS